MKLSTLKAGLFPAAGGGQGVRTGSLSLVVALGLSGVMTLIFQGLSTRLLGIERWGAVATLWSATFLFAQVLWVGFTQTLARHISDREARGESWDVVVRSVRRLEGLLLAAFVGITLLLSPLLTRRLFAGEPVLTAAFVLSVSGYAVSYFRRGLFSGHRQFLRLSAMLLVESFGRVLLAAVLLLAGVGVIGPAAAIAIAPLLSVLLVRPPSVAEPEREGGPFSLGGAFGFAMPVLVTMASAQVLANGGPILISGLGGANAHSQSGLLLNALTLTRMPQFVLSPVVNSLLPHLSRIAAVGGEASFNRFVKRAVGLIVLVDIGLVLGVWLLGEQVMPLLYGSEARMSRDLLVVLAILAALYLMGELLNQVLFARGLTPYAAGSWLLGVVGTGVATLLIQTELLHRISYALAVGSAVTVLSLAASHLLTRRSRPLGTTAEPAPQQGPTEPAIESRDVP